MKRLLIISYDWLPKGSVGMIRILRFIKYLIREGYAIHVITREDTRSGKVYWDMEEPEIKKVKVHRVPLAKRPCLFCYLKDKLNPQFEARWFNAVRAKLDTLLSDIDFDVVISSSPPESNHAIAAFIKKKSGKPWIADLRDLWAYDHYRGFSGIRRFFLLNEEKNILGKADRVITVSRIWAELLKRHYGGARVGVITNSYDEEYFNRIPSGQNDKFTIAYLGKLNRTYQDITDFLYGMKDLIESGTLSRDKISADFYISGYGKPDLKNMASRLGMSDIIHEYSYISFGKALEVIKKANLLLLVGWKGISANGWRPQKAYEYLGSGVPILLINSLVNTELEDLIISTESGSVASNISDVKAEITKYYRKFIEKEIVSGRRNNEKVSEYAASNITTKLSQVIEEV